MLFSCSPFSFTEKYLKLRHATKVEAPLNSSFPDNSQPKKFLLSVDCKA